jgi:hypothetical protein
MCGQRLELSAESRLASVEPSRPWAKGSMIPAKRTTQTASSVFFAGRILPATAPSLEADFFLDKKAEIAYDAL